jgi:hypothetical protein
MVPFHTTRLFGWSVTADGIAMVNGQGVQLAFQRPDENQELRDANIRTLEIPWESLQSLECDYGVLSDSIRLSVRSSSALQGLPGADEQHVELTVHKQHRDQLKDFERRLREYQSGNRRDDTDELLDDVRDFLEGN